MLMVTVPMKRTRNASSEDMMMDEWNGASRKKAEQNRPTIPFRPNSYVFPSILPNSLPAPSRVQTHPSQPFSSHLPHRHLEFLFVGVHTSSESYLARFASSGPSTLFVSHHSAQHLYLVPTGLPCTLTRTCQKSAYAYTHIRQRSTSARRTHSLTLLYLVHSLLLTSLLCLCLCQLLTSPFAFDLCSTYTARTDILASPVTSRQSSAPRLRAIIRSRYPRYPLPAW